MHFPWLIYIKQRFPLPVYLLLSVGIASQGQLAFKPEPEFSALALASGMILLFFFCLRLMDEVKDYHKDQIAHPDRPLPRGLVQKTTAEKLIRFCLVLQLGLALYLAWNGLHYAAYFWILTTGWLYLMYVEFYSGAWLEQRPFFYASTHQLILLPLVLAAAHGRGDGDSREAIYSGLMILGAFFTYEIARKLDTKAHPLLKTYRLVYGRRGTLSFLLMTSALAIIGALLKFQDSLPKSALYIVLTSLTWLVCARFGETRPKLAETLASVSLLVHIWGPVLMAISWGAL